MYDIETQLAALKPTGQTPLARRILDVSSRRRQRRRDCFVGLGGLLTGIAATVLVMVFPFAETMEPMPVVVYVPVVQEVVFSEPVAAPKIDFAQRHEGHKEMKNSFVSFVPLCETNTTDPLDLDVWIARYEKLLRHRQLVSRTVYTLPVTMPVLPDRMSPLEYRDRLLLELGG